MTKVPMDPKVQEAVLKVQAGGSSGDPLLDNLARYVIEKYGPQVEPPKPKPTPVAPAIDAAMLLKMLGMLATAMKQQPVTTADLPQATPKKSKIPQTFGDAGIAGTKNAHRLQEFSGRVVSWSGYKWDGHSPWYYRPHCPECGQVVESRGWPSSKRITGVDKKGDKVSRVAQFTCANCEHQFGKEGRTEHGRDLLPRMLAGGWSTTIAFVFPRQMRRPDDEGRPRYMWYTTLYHDINAGYFPVGSYEGQSFDAGEYTLDCYNAKVEGEEADRVPTLVKRPFIIQPNQYNRWKLSGEVFVVGETPQVIEVEGEPRKRAFTMPLMLRHHRQYAWWRTPESPNGEWVPEFLMAGGDVPELELVHEKGDLRDETRWKAPQKWNDIGMGV